MTSDLRYGANSILRLDLGDEGQHVIDAPRGHACDDPIAAVIAALDQPVASPPLRQSLVSGDRIVLALAPHVPRPAEIVRGVLKYLSQHQIEPGHLTVMYSPDDSVPANLLAGVTQELGALAELLRHDANDRSQHAYLAADESAYVTGSEFHIDGGLLAGSAASPGD